MTGEPVEMLVYCGANDVGLLTPGNEEWDLETVVAESGEAATVTRQATLARSSATGLALPSMETATRPLLIATCMGAASKGTT